MGMGMFVCSCLTWICGFQLEMQVEVQVQDRRWKGHLFFLCVDAHLNAFMAWSYRRCKRSERSVLVKVVQYASNASI